MQVVRTGELAAHMPGRRGPWFEDQVCALCAQLDRCERHVYVYCDDVEVLRERRKKEALKDGRT